MTYSEKINHYINCMLFYFETMVYQKNENSCYINDQVDKIFEFEKWINRISDDEIMYECDYDSDVTAKEIRDGVKESIKGWIKRNCEGGLK